MPRRLTNEEAERLAAITDRIRGELLSIFEIVLRRRYSDASVRRIFAEVKGEVEKVDAETVGEVYEGLLDD